MMLGMIVPPEIELLYSQWSAAYIRKDVDSILGLITPDYLLFMPGRPPIPGSALRPQLEAAFAAYDVELHYEREECIVSGDLAFDRGFDVQTVVPRNGGDTRHQRQRVFLILRRGDDRAWRFARGVSIVTE
jgi:ketosteroid isomerase-like protein